MSPLDDPVVLLCGSRFYPWPRTVWAILDRLLTRYGDRLVVVEGFARGADADAHAWCLGQGFGNDRHRCHPIDWAAERRVRDPKMLWRAGHDRNVRMLAVERPKLIIACHNDFSYAKGGTSHMCLAGLLAGVPAWLAPTEDPSAGMWVELDKYPETRIRETRRELAAAGIDYVR